MKLKIKHNAVPAEPVLELELRQDGTSVSLYAGDVYILSIEPSPTPHIVRPMGNALEEFDSRLQLATGELQ